MVVAQKKGPGQLLPADHERSRTESEERAPTDEAIKVDIERLPSQIKTVVRTGVG